MLSNKHSRTTSYNKSLKNITRRLKHGTTESRGGIGVISSLGNLENGKYFSKKGQKFSSPLNFLNKKQRRTYHKGSHVHSIESIDRGNSSFRGEGRFNRVRESRFGTQFMKNPSNGVKSSRNLKYGTLGFGSPERKLDYRGSKFGYLKVKDKTSRIEDVRNLGQGRRFLSENKTFNIIDNKENMPKVSQLNFYSNKTETPHKILGNSFSNIKNLSQAVSPARTKIQISKREGSPADVLREIRVSAHNNGSNFFNDDESNSRVTNGKLDHNHRLTSTSISRLSNTSCSQQLTTTRNTLTRSTEYRIRASEVGSSGDFSGMKESTRVNQSCVVNSEREIGFKKFGKSGSVFSKFGKNRFSKSI